MNSSIGQIISLPSSYSAYATVRDEYGSERTVHASEIPADAEPGDSMPYKVDIWSHRSGNAMTLRFETYGPP